MKQYLRKIRAFTLIELLVVVSIIGLISALAVTNFSRTRQVSRDAQRRSDLHALTDALELYKIGHASYFVTTPGADPNCPAKLTIASSEGDTTFDANTLRNAPCNGTMLTGAGGRAFGAISLASQSLNGPPGSVSGGGINSHIYATTSIVQALVSGQYLSKAVKDPANPGTTNDPNAADYVLVRCCLGGVENINPDAPGSRAGSLFAFWAKLEIVQSAADQNTSSQYCGGNRNGTYDNSQVDFGVANNVLNPSGRLDSQYAFAVGNGTPKVGKLGSCNEVALDR